MSSIHVPVSATEMIPRTIFNEDHEAFRNTVRRFMEEEVAPHRERWEEQQHVDRETWKKAGSLGLLCPTMPEEYGGMGVDRIYSMVMIEEQSRVGATGPGWGLHSDIVANYLNNFGTEAQKSEWLPKMATGDVITSIAMTEPGTGSDLQSIKTRAVLDGDYYILNGSKIFITNGWLCDMALVVCKTGEEDKGAGSVSILIVDASSEGFSKGKPLKKVGMKAQDTSELFFENVKVPKENLLGGIEGMGFVQLMKELAWERLIIAIGCIKSSEMAIAHTLEYVKERKVFGRPVSKYQNTKFKLAELVSEVSIGQVYVDQCMELQEKGKLSPAAAAASKYWCSDLLSKVVDECVQLHGGYGYMLEYPIAQAYVDTRANRIYAGTNEIMKEIISRTL